MTPQRLLTLALVAQAFLLVWNLAVVRRPRARKWGSGAPLLSCLVPARDEEAVIEGCVGALLGQHYPNIEVLVLDDGSSDGTAARVAAQADPRLRLVPGGPLPPAWTGKNWACHQLAAQAVGDVLCFVDADTVLAPDAVASCVGELRESDLGLLTLLLRNETVSLAEQVLIPMVNYAFLALTPVAVVEHARHPDLAIGIGPFLMVTREAYTASGGHAAAPGHLVDDMHLARSIKGAGYRTGLANGTDLAQTRFSTGLRPIWDGFSKNAFGALAYRAWFAILAIAVLVPPLVLPFVRLGLGLLAGEPLDGETVLQVGLIVGVRAAAAVATRDRIWSAPLHPLAVLFWAATLAHSMVLAYSGGAVSWKGREYAAGEPATERPKRD